MPLAISESDGTGAAGVARGVATLACVPARFSRESRRCSMRSSARERLWTSVSRRDRRSSPRASSWTPPLAPLRLRLGVSPHSSAHAWLVGHDRVEVEQHARRHERSTEQNERQERKGAAPVKRDDLYDEPSRDENAGK